MDENVVKMSDTKIFETLKEILYEVAPEKVSGELNQQISLVEDFAFDSIDIVKMLLEIRNRFFEGSESFDVEKWLYEGFSNMHDEKFLVKKICEMINENLTQATN